MEKIYQELKEQKNVRSNLSALRAQLKKDAKAQAYAQAETFAEENKSLFWNWLESDDAKTRKNAALLLGEIEYEPAVENCLLPIRRNRRCLFAVLIWKLWQNLMWNRFYHS